VRPRGCLWYQVRMLKRAVLPRNALLLVPFWLQDSFDFTFLSFSSHTQTHAQTTQDTWNDDSGALWAAWWV